MIDPKLKAMLVTLRAALLMAAKAIEKYLDEEVEAVTVNASDTIAAALPK